MRLLRPTSQRRPRRVLVGVVSIAAVLLPAAGIAYLGAVSYRDDRGIVAAKLDEQFRAAVTIASQLERDVRQTLDAVSGSLTSERPQPGQLAQVREAHPLAALPFRVGPGGKLEFPSPEPLRRPGARGGDFLARAPRTCPERGFDACIRAIRASRRRARQLDAARRRELGPCAAMRETGPCEASAREREAARRAYVGLARYEDTGPDALLGLARLAAQSGDATGAAAHYASLGERFGMRTDDDGVTYQLIADLGRAELAVQAQGDQSAVFDVYERLLARTYEAPGAMLERIADSLKQRLQAAPLDPAGQQRLSGLNTALDFAHEQTRLARALAGEVDEIVRTAGTQARGRPALTALERTLIYRRQADNSIVGMIVDLPMLERRAAQVDVELASLAPGTRAIVEGPGDSATRATTLRTLATMGFGALLPHLNVSLVNDRNLPDPLDEIIESRGRRHLAITGGLVALLLFGILATVRGAARERELARLKSDFVSTVSHELKTPLTSIRMFGEMLQQGVAGSDSERERRYHDIIVKESQRLGLLIANLLDYSQIERGTRRYNPQPESATEIARDAVTTFQRFRETPVDISLDDGDEQVDIVVDREVVVQSLLNLLGNAIKYGEPPIAVTVTATDERVTLAVGDRGAGIPAPEQERIFREFYRAPAAYSSGVEGTGLGLALVKRHVEAQGGTVAVTSEPDRGATFSISFPR